MRDWLRMSVHTMPLEHCREKLSAGTEMGKMKRWGQRVKETGRACGVQEDAGEKDFLCNWSLSKDRASPFPCALILSMEEQELQISSHSLFGDVFFSLALALMCHSSNIFQVTFHTCIGQLTWSRRHGRIMDAFHRAGAMCWRLTGSSPEKEALAGITLTKAGLSLTHSYAEAQLTHWELKFGMDQLRAVSWLITLAKKFSLVF